MITLAKFKKHYEDFTTRSSITEKSPREIESENIAKILPDDLYHEVALILGLDLDIKRKMAEAKKKRHKKLYKDVKRLTRTIQTITVDKSHTTDEYYTGSSVEPPTPKEKASKKFSNPYYIFFQKTERQQVQWESKYLPPETEMEKGLIRRADELTNKICGEFCSYMQSLGGYDSEMFKEDFVKELFQIEFNAHITKSVKVETKILKSTTQEVSISTNNPDIYVKNVLNKEIKNDIKAEKKIAQKTAFGQTLPKNMQWKPLRNNTQASWAHIHNLSKKITTMENVWGEITNYKSAQDFCQWILDHQVKDCPTYLKRSGMLNERSLYKVKHIGQYDAANKLPKVDTEKQLSGTSETTKSLPLNNMKIKNINPMNK